MVSYNKVVSSKTEQILGKRFADYILTLGQKLRHRFVTLGQTLNSKSKEVKHDIKNSEITLSNSSSCFSVTIILVYNFL